MRKIIIASLFMFLACNCIDAQTRKTDFCPTVKINDSIKVRLLEITYGKEEQLSPSDCLYIFNLNTPKDHTLKNGIYSFRGMGSHFPRRIFIFHNGMFFIFQSIGAYDPQGLIKEYNDCINELQLNDIEIREYLMEISIYLKEEEGNTYGAEIKK